MTTPSPDRSTVAQRLRFALRAIEVRLRFVAAIGVAVACVAGWPWLQNVWDRARHQHSGRPNAAVAGDTEFFCPMDPGVRSAWPAICPICNMDLVPRKKTDAVLLPEGAVARMQLSPYRIQLAGIRTSTVESKPLTYAIAFTGRLQAGTGDSAAGRLFFEAIPAAVDLPLLNRPRPVKVRPAFAAEPVVDGTATLVEADGASKVRVELREGVSLPLEGVLATLSVSAAETLNPPGGEERGVLAIPDSAVVDRGEDRLVYVETMPGMFDAVRVELGRGTGGFYPVVAGLKPGQKVATTGSFLIDAETRLDPALAVQYFGAGRQASASRIPAVPQSARLAKKLSAADQALAKEQRVCPVTGLGLDSMGGPVLVETDGRKVFLCCKGCEPAFRADPGKYLKKLK